MRTLCLIPVKDMKYAKSRLDEILTQAQRSTLALSMLEDVLSSVTRVRGINEIRVITKDARAKKLARKFRVKIQTEKRNNGQTHAVSAVLSSRAVKKFQRVLLLPADIPLVKPSDIQKVLRAQKTNPSLVFVPAHDGRGTNAILAAPPDIFMPQYGNDSFKPHVKRAEESGITYKILKLASIALDVDNKRDFELLRKKCRSGKTYEWLKKEGCWGQRAGGRKKKIGNRQETTGNRKGKK